MFEVKLLIVFETSNEESRQDLQANCTHVGGDYWLYEGDELALHNGINFNIVSEAAIESYGGMNSITLKEMVKGAFGIDVDGKDIDKITGRVIFHPETVTFSGPTRQYDADEPRYKIEIHGAESVVKPLADAIGV